jgi:hypothetical protein
VTDGTLRERWVAEVFRTPHVSAEVKVFLLYLAHYTMDSAGRIEEPRDLLAEQMGVHPRKISGKFAAAIASGLLRQVVRGQKHQVAVYQAVVPGEPNSQGAGSGHPGEASRVDAQGADCGHPEDAQGALTRQAEVSQGAGFYHPEESAQGASNRHPETSQGAQNRHPENSGPYKDRTGAHSNGERSCADADVTGHGDESVVIALFDDIKTPPPAGASADPAEPPAITAQTVVAAWVDAVRLASGEPPTKRLIGSIARQAKELLDKEGRDPERLVDAAAALGSKIGSGYTNLGQEYLMTATRQHAATGTDGRSGPRDAVNSEDWTNGFEGFGNQEGSG